MSAFLVKPSGGKNYVNEIRTVATKNRALIDEDTMEDLKEAFTLFDTNHNGSIDYRELKAALRALGVKNVTKQSTLDIFKEVYAEYALACKEAALRRNPSLDRATFYVPFAIMVSDDTHDRTV